jgi:hypothetical protein
MTRKIFPMLPILAAALVLGAALPALAADGASGPEALRADLLAYIENLHQLPVGMLDQVYGENLSLAEARQRVLDMSPEELARVEASLAQVPYWRELPALLAASLPAGGGSPHGSLGPRGPLGPLDLAAAVDARAAAAGGDPRARMMAMVDALERLPDGAAGDGFASRVARLRTRLESLSPARTAELQRAMSARMPGWRATVEARMAGELPPASIARRTTENCNSLDFPNDILCEIDHVIDAIAEIPGEVTAFAETAFNDIVGFLEGLLATLDEDLLPDEQDIIDGIEAVTGLDLSDGQWMVDFFGSWPVLEPPCPSNGFTIPGLGEMGTMEANLTCKRSIRWVAEAIYDNAPDDIWGVPFKLVMAAIFYPVDYLCLCYEAAAEIEYDDLQAAHRDLVDDNLDVTVSSRASQTSVDTAQASTEAIGDAVDGVQGQVDALGSSIADLDGDVARVEGKIDVLGGELANIQDQEDEQSLFLLDFQELALRLRIEADLVRAGDDRVVSFQLPEVVGGFLEVVQQIVFETLEDREAAGRDMSHARSDFARGNDAYAALDFHDAYTYYRRAYQTATRGGV